MSNPLHITDIETYFRCPRKFQYSNVDRIKKKPSYSGKAEEYIVTAEDEELPLTYGSAGHRALARWYGGENNLAEIASEEFNNFDEGLKEQAIRLLRHYERTYSTDREKWEVIIGETPITFELIPGYTFEFTVDLLIKIISKGEPTYWVVDHKFYAKKASIYELELRDQFLGYAYVCKHYFNIPLSGIIPNCIIKKDIELPKILQSGQLSLDKSQNTTISEIERMGFREDERTKPFFDHLRTGKEDPFLDRHFFLKTDRELNRWRENFEKKLQDVGRHDFPVIGFHCGKCTYKTLCHSTIKGSERGIREEYYIPKEDGER